MTPVPAARAVISSTPDGSRVLKENGKLIYRNFHPEQTVQPGNPTRRCTKRLPEKKGGGRNCRHVLPVTLMRKDAGLIGSNAIVFRSAAPTLMLCYRQSPQLRVSFGQRFNGTDFKSRASAVITLEMSTTVWTRKERGLDFSADDSIFDFRCKMSVWGDDNLFYFWAVSLEEENL